MYLCCAFWERWCWSRPSHCSWRRYWNLDDRCERCTLGPCWRTCGRSVGRVRCRGGGWRSSNGSTASCRARRSGPDRAPGRGCVLTIRRCAAELLLTARAVSCCRIYVFRQPTPRSRSVGWYLLSGDGVCTGLMGQTQWLPVWSVRDLHPDRLKVVEHLCVPARPHAADEHLGQVQRVDGEPSAAVPARNSLAASWFRSCGWRCAVRTLASSVITRAGLAQVGQVVLAKSSGVLAATAATRLRAVSFCAVSKTLAPAWTSRTSSLARVSPDHRFAATSKAHPAGRADGRAPDGVPAHAELRDSCSQRPDR